MNTMNRLDWVVRKPLMFVVLLSMTVAAWVLWPLFQPDPMWVRICDGDLYKGFVGGGVVLLDANSIRKTDEGIKYEVRTEYPSKQRIAMVMTTEGANCDLNVYRDKPYRYEEYGDLNGTNKPEQDRDPDIQAMYDSLNKIWWERTPHWNQIRPDEKWLNGDRRESGFLQPHCDAEDVAKVVCSMKR